jgi:DNA repair protein RecO (recombination protein O)
VTNALAKERLTSAALLVRLVPYRDADAIVHLFTEDAGAVTAMARGARKSKRRFASLEPMHTLRATVDLREGREMGTLIETDMARLRLGLTASLGALEAAGQALRWVRRAAPARTPEPLLWSELVGLLDDLDASAEHAACRLAGSGLRMLAAAGWALELDHCVRCGRACPDNARAIIDVNAGGVVCRTCGARGVVVTSAQRRGMQQALRGAPFVGDPIAVVSIVDHAFEAHGRGEAT